MRLFFYLKYALRNLWRSRRWSAFAVFSVAAGVATMVALRSLGLSIGDSLTADARSANKGDITLSTRNERMFSALTAADDNSANFTDTTLRRLEVWTAERGGTLTEYRFNSGAQLTKVGSVTAGRPQFINAFYIDPVEYPVTGTIFAEDPAGVPLGELFSGEGNEVVIARSLADREDIRVGDIVRVSGSEGEFVVRGIVPTASQAGLYTLFSREFLSVFFGFAYFDRQAVQGVIATNLGVDVPMHFTAFHPDWKMITTPRTPVATLRKARDIAQRNGIRYVYTGNVFDPRGQSTYCHRCHACLIDRSGYAIRGWSLDADGCCMNCHTRCAGFFDPSGIRNYK